MFEVSTEDYRKYVTEVTQCNLVRTGYATIYSVRSHSVVIFMFKPFMNIFANLPKRRGSQNFLDHGHLLQGFYVAGHTRVIAAIFEVRIVNRKE
jgi:hypothetical protein